MSNFYFNSTSGFRPLIPHMGNYAIENTATQRAIETTRLFFSSNEAKGYYATIITFLNERKFTAVIQYCDLAITKYPREIVPLIAKAQALLSLGRYVEAAEVAQNVQALDPTSEEAAFILNKTGTIELNLKARILLNNGNTIEAIRTAKNVISLSPNNELALTILEEACNQINNQAKRLVMSSEPEELSEPEKMLSSLLEELPRNADAISILARISLDREDYYTAIQYAQKALQYTEDRVFTLRTLVMAHAALHQYGEALDFAQQILAIDPTDIVALQWKNEYRQHLLNGKNQAHKLKKLR